MKYEKEDFVQQKILEELQMKQDNEFLRKECEHLRKQLVQRDKAIRDRNRQIQNLKDRLRKPNSQ